MVAPSRHRCRQQARQDHRRIRRATRAATPHAPARAGERGLASGCGVSVAGESAVKRLYPLVRELAADGIPVAVSCRVLKLSRQPYYRWLAAPVPEAEVLEAYRGGPMRSSTPMPMTRNLGTGTWLMRPRLPVSRWQ